MTHPSSKSSKRRSLTTSSLFASSPTSSPTPTTTNDRPTYNDEVKLQESTVSIQNNDNENGDNAYKYFDILAGNVVNCLIKSDLKRKGGGDGGGSTGWTSWVDDASAYQLKSCIDFLSLNLLQQQDQHQQEGQVKRGVEEDNLTTIIDKDDYTDHDKVISWMRWLKASPAPLVIEMSNELRNAANQYIYDDDLEVCNA